MQVDIQAKWGLQMKLQMRGVSLLILSRFGHMLVDPLTDSDYEMMNVASLSVATKFVIKSDILWYIYIYIFIYLFI